MGDIFDEDLFDVFEKNPTSNSQGKSHVKFNADSEDDSSSDECEGVDNNQKTEDIVFEAQSKPTSEGEQVKGPVETIADESLDSLPGTSKNNTSKKKQKKQSPSDAVQAEPEPGSSGSKRKKRSPTPENSKTSEKKVKHETKGDGDVEMLSEEEKNDVDEEEFLRRQTTKEEIEDLRKFLPQVETKHLETSEDSGCTHVVAYPKGSYYIPLQPIEKMVKTYNFTLDLFQERAVTCVDNYQSVLVSAHTSAGKTVVAEYAIAKGLKDNQRIIYTTPIKALSNQKYREFSEEFKDVGLITGDVTINPSSSCLIMTTEILRNMLYRGSEIMREVGWVIFDEVHYMKDPERGVVWEETIILLPQKTHYVFLSATIPNAMQFAEWICFLHKQPCNVIHTEYRPVPLHHYVYPVGGDGITLIVDDLGNFREDNFTSAVSLIQNEEGYGGKRNKNKGDDTTCHKLIKMAMERDLAPIIVFSFSKKDCEVYALQLAKLDFNTADDKLLVEEVFGNAIDVLSKDDQKLPQVENLLPLLKRGIGIHHGGLLPLLKETIEILFSEGLIKVLFATETFAMGLNMPARTVLFTSTRKFDGKDYRWITSGEYIQMSGRAGRRGIDDKGVAIVVLDEKISPSVGRTLFKGHADAINSQFHLTYNMVLNLMRVEEINPEYMMERSFYQFQNYSSIPSIIEKLVAAEKEYEEMKVPREEEISTYYDLREQLRILKTEFRSYAFKPMYVVPFLQPGRMLYLSQNGIDIGWGVLVNFQRRMNPRENPMTCTPTYVLDVVIAIDREKSLDSNGTVIGLHPPKKRHNAVIEVVPITLHIVEYISKVRLYCPKDLKSEENKRAVQVSIDEVIKKFPKGVPLLDPVRDLGIREKGFDTCVKNIKKFEERLFAHSLHDTEECKDLYKLYVKKAKLYDDVKLAKAELRKAKSLLQMDELKCRKRVLRRLGYASADDVIEIKGRVACELTSGDELLLTEMIFNGIFIDMDVAKTVAMLSCLVCDERSNDVPKLSEELSGPLKMMQDIARQIAKVSNEAKLEVDEEKYVDQFKPYLMDVVYAWCQGSSFAKLCEKTDIFEGGIIRCMRRLEELLRQMSMAAKVIGNKDLEEKFCEGVKLIKRDIVFAASLYL